MSAFRLTATGLSDYERCPTLFYFAHILQLLRRPPLT